MTTFGDTERGQGDSVRGHEIITGGGLGVSKIERFGKII